MDALIALLLPFWKFVGALALTTVCITALGIILGLAAQVVMAIYDVWKDLRGK